MRPLLFTVCILVLLAPASFAQASAGNQMKMDSINQRIRGHELPEKEEQLPLDTARKINLAEVQQKTDELNTLVKSLNGDMAKLRKGMIAADVNQRLKRIEKLAKEIRQELQ